MAAHQSSFSLSGGAPDAGRQGRANVAVRNQSQWGHSAPAAGPATLVPSAGGGATGRRRGDAVPKSEGISLSGGSSDTYRSNRRVASAAQQGSTSIYGGQQSGAYDAFGRTSKSSPSQQQPRLTPQTLAAVDGGGGGGSGGSGGRPSSPTESMSSVTSSVAAARAKPRTLADFRGGGSRGAGKGIALAFGSLGDIVYVTGRSQQEGDAPLPGTVFGTVKEINKRGGTGVAVICDHSDDSQVEKLFKQIEADHGRLDILVNNAGSRPGGDRKLVVDVTEEDFDLVQRVNLKGTFLVSQAVARHMIKRGGGGKIISMSSRAGKTGTAMYAAYCASKFGVIGFTQSLAQELAQHNIMVNAICPGLVDTERVDYIAAATAPEGQSAIEYRADMVRDRAATVPLGRLAVAADIAKTAAFLASAESDYLTGQSINVAGGYEMH